MWQQILAILLVLGLLAGTLALLRRKGLAQFSTNLRATGGRNKQMQVVERIPLTPHHSLHLVSVRNKLLLIGVSPSGCSRLAHFATDGSLPPEELQ